MLLGALEGDQDLRADLHNWNEAKVLEMEEWLATMTGAELEAAQERIRQYREMRGNTAPQSFAS